MANKEHNASSQVHKARYVQSSDPGAVGAGIEWRDTNTTPAVEKIRNPGNTGWDTIEHGATNIANNAITTAKIIDDAVTYAKLQNIAATARLLGRITAGAGNAEEIPLGAGLAFSGGALISTVAAPTVIKTTADQAMIGSGLANVTGMSFSVAANTDYLFEFFVAYISTTFSVGLVLAVTCPAAATLFSYVADIPNIDDSGTAVFHGHGTVSGDAITSPNSPEQNAAVLARVTGIIRNGANSGSIQLQAANETATNSITIKRGSMVRYQPVA